MIAIVTPAALVDLLRDCGIAVTADTVLAWSAADRQIAAQWAFTSDLVARGLVADNPIPLPACLPLPSLAPLFPPLSPGERQCRTCGCTDTHSCGDCYWVEPDLCSACANPEGDNP